MKSFNGKELHLMRGAIYRKIIYDIKPRLDSVSNALGQLKTYSHFMTYVRYYNGQKSTRLSEPDLTILTFDNDTSFDSLCKEQGVIIFHLSPNDIKN